MAALAVMATVREFVGASSALPQRVELKWMNDVLLNGKKCAGILVETSIVAERLQYAIVGIGINVNFSMSGLPELAPVATTLSDALGHALDRAALEAHLLAQLEAYYARLRAGESFRQEYRAHLSTIGQHVRGQTPWGVEEGIATDVDEDGALLLRRRGGTIALHSGEVTILK